MYLLSHNTCMKTLQCTEYINACARLDNLSVRVTILLFAAGALSVISTMVIIIMGCQRWYSTRDILQLNYVPESPTYLLDIIFDLLDIFIDIL